MKAATSSDLGELVRVKLLDGGTYTGRLVYMDSEWVDVATSDEPGSRKRTLSPIDEVASIEVVPT